MLKRSPPMPHVNRLLTGPRAATGGVRAAVVLLLLLATIWQSCLLGTHNHLRQSPVSLSSITQQIGKAPLPSREAPLPADNCPLCQEAANAGNYLPVVPVVIVPPAPVVAWYGQTDTRQIADRQRSHDWRSRAPPLPLQA